MCVCVCVCVCVCCAYEHICVCMCICVCIHACVCPHPLFLSLSLSFWLGAGYSAVEQVERSKEFVQGLPEVNKEVVRFVIGLMVKVSEGRV